MLGVYKMSLFDLTGKSILITGSSKGIGKSIATRYAEYGAKVIISSRTSETCVATADEINTNLGKELAYPIACNISHQEQLEYLVSKKYLTISYFMNKLLHLPANFIDIICQQYSN